MKNKYIVILLGAFLVAMGVVAMLALDFPSRVLAADQLSNKVEPLLLDKFSTEGQADFIVRFTNSADLSPAYSMDWEQRGEFVYNALLDTAVKSQVNTKAILDRAGLRYQTFVAGNELYVWNGASTAAYALAELPEVYFIRATRTYYIDPVVIVNPLEGIRWVGDLLANNLLVTVNNSTELSRLGHFLHQSRPVLDDIWGSRGWYPGCEHRYRCSIQPSSTGPGL